MVFELYDQEVIEEDVILSWYGNDTRWNESTEEERKIRDELKKFVEWLENASEEEDSD